MNIYKLTQITQFLETLLANKMIFEYSSFHQNKLTAVFRLDKNIRYYLNKSTNFQIQFWESNHFPHFWLIQKCIYQHKKINFSNFETHLKGNLSKIEQLNLFLIISNIVNYYKETKVRIKKTKPIVPIKFNLFGLVCLLKTYISTKIILPTFKFYIGIKFHPHFFLFLFVHFV